MKGKRILMGKGGGKKNLIFREGTWWTNRKTGGNLILPLRRDLVSIWAVGRALVALSHSWTLILSIKSGTRQKRALCSCTDTTREQRLQFFWMPGDDAQISSQRLSWSCPLLPPAASPACSSLLLPPSPAYQTVEAGAETPSYRRQLLSNAVSLCHTNRLMDSMKCQKGT